MEMKYKTLVIDPPWPISMTGIMKRRPNTATKLPYDTMSLQEIKDFTLVSELAETGAHVYLWTTIKYLREAFAVLEAWHVNYHLTLVWHKPSGIAPVPTGYQFATEFCLLGFYGKPMVPYLDSAVVPNHISAMPKSHSTKPAEFYDLIRKKSPEPRIDIFARKRHYGFDAWGNQAETEPEILEAFT